MRLCRRCAGLCPLLRCGSTSTALAAPRDNPRPVRSAGRCALAANYPARPPPADGLCAPRAPGRDDWSYLAARPTPPATGQRSHSCRTSVDTESGASWAGAASRGSALGTRSRWESSKDTGNWLSRFRAVRNTERYGLAPEGSIGIFRWSAVWATSLAKGWEGLSVASVSSATAR